MDKIIEFRRLRWIALVQQQLYQIRQSLLANKLLQLNSEETAIEYVNNELLRLAKLEQTLLELSYRYDFLEDFTLQDVIDYVDSYIGSKDLV